MARPAIPVAGDQLYEAADASGERPVRPDESAIARELAGRFSIRRTLGNGSFGVVYEAYDHDRDALVALKELKRLDGTSIYAFKQEFRALADVAHDNLVGLHELISIEDQWYLTMDLVEGQSFLSYVRETLGNEDPTLTAASGARLLTVFQSTVRPIGIDDATLMAVESDEILRPDPQETQATPRSTGLGHKALREDRLRDALLQLTAGVQAIHDAGRFHRDLKPSNVLVDTQGRVVILDFGLVESIAKSASASGEGAPIVGTPLYMAPEQANGVGLGPACDWYAVGVMLYEALTGDVPFNGPHLLAIFARKLFNDPVPPSELDPSLPPDLCQLAMHLLARKPEERAGAKEIRQVLGASRSHSSDLRESESAWSNRQSLPFLGRERELGVMRDALEQVKAGRTVVLHVHGTSGMGKSDLIRHFLDELSNKQPSPLVLEGRCHEREWLPYKALDGAMDALTQHLATLSTERARALLPRDLPALARLFPVLRQLESTELSEQSIDVLDPHEIRRRAFTALRELFTRLAESRPLVLYIDDLQWGDTDSATLLSALLSPPAPPPLLLIASYRSEEAAQSEAVQCLPKEQDDKSPHLLDADPSLVLARELSVGPLAHEDACALALALLGTIGQDANHSAERIAGESSGSPFFLQELARAMAFGHTESELSLANVVSARVRRLPETTRTILEVVAVAGRPLDTELLRKATGLSGNVEHTALMHLRSSCLIRLWSARRVETYHDRIREAVVKQLEETRISERHNAIADAMEATEGSDPEALAMHLRMAGKPARARTYMERAAERATAALAFDRAAQLYQSALELADAESAPRLKIRLAEALANAGRGYDAGRAFVRAAEATNGSEALYARRRAVEQLLRSGRIDEGLDAVRAILPSVGLEFPPTLVHAFGSMMIGRAKLKLRGLSFRERDEQSIPRHELERIDVCWAIGNGLGGFDVIRSADFLGRHMLLALRAGEPSRIACALCWEVITLSYDVRSPSKLERMNELLARATEIAERLRHPYVLAWVAGARATVNYQRGAWRKSVLAAKQSIRLCQEAARGMTWEMGSMYSWWLCSGLWYLGDIEESQRQVHIGLKLLEELGDLYSMSTLGTWSIPLLHFTADRPEQARRESEETIRRWSQRNFYFQHFFDLMTRAQAFIYEGEGQRALELIDAHEDALRRLFIRWIQVSRIYMTDIYGRAALCELRRARGMKRMRLARLVEERAQQLSKEGIGWATGCALSLRAGLASVKGETAKAAALLARAAEVFDGQEMAMHAACARRKRGELLGGTVGRALVEEADAWMTGRTIRNPAALTAFFHPG